MYGIEKQAKKVLAKQQANFIDAWSSSTIREARDKFHHNFKAGMQIDPLGYKGVNLG